MREIQWYYPTLVEEAVSLIKREGVIAHAGGTNILRGSLKRVKGLVDLSHLPLKYHRHRGNTVEIGACITLADAAAYLEQTNGENVLVKALKSAASTPLRNRITLGGSIALFPAWSDPMGPLIALDAEVELAGKKSGYFPVTRYVDEPAFRKDTLITGVRVRMDTWMSFYYRETRTAADHPAFTVTLLLKSEEDRITDLRGVIIGCVGRYQRLLQLEEWLVGMQKGGVSLGDIGRHVNVSFTGKKFLSPAYLKHLVDVQVERGIAELTGR